ncbi:MAG: carbohydrate kinase family protein [Candidatus Adiutrix sp.]|jgi:adenosine kinase|nr:carbohydrate kinase family protein [Candidatus Adiutrix sp.]
MTLICSGSLAYDRLLSYDGLFAESFLADRLDIINVCFVANDLQVAFGGTAGNIAYNLGLLGEKPLVAGCLGEDPDGGEYLRRLKDQGCLTEAVKIQAGRATAGCTIATDRHNNQLTFFHPGAMAAPSGFDPAALPRPFDQHLAIVSPGGQEEMKSLCQAYRELGYRFIFDPGQQIPAFSGPELTEMLEGAAIFICNEYEYDLFQKITGLSPEGIFQRAETVIVTLGAKGCDLIVPGRGSQHLDPVPVSSVANPTGAGDAFRAGLLKALGKPRPEHLITACRLGATVAAFCVETEGGPQAHRFTPAQVAARHAAAFREEINL